MLQYTPLLFELQVFWREGHMIGRLKKIGLALIALALFLGNTNWWTGVIIWLTPEGSSYGYIFVVVAVIANIQVCVWYLLGHELVPVLAESYFSAQRFFCGSGSSWVPNGISRFVLAILEPFHQWEKTKVGMELLMKSILSSKRGMVKTFLVWLFVPGGRIVTALVFGMNSWRGGLVLLICANTLHVALGFSFWRLILQIFNKLGQFLSA